LLHVGFSFEGGGDPFNTPLLLDKKRGMTMKDKRSLHLKMLELCDCYATTDYLKEMSQLPQAADDEEGALKWMALTILHGINANAKKIALSKKPDGGITVVAKYRKTELPSPGGAVGEKVLEVVREITHIEGEGGKIPLAVAIRDSSFEVKIKVAQDEEGETVTLEFPK
jgi:hypothetical protein